MKQVTRYGDVWVHHPPGMVVVKALWRRGSRGGWATIFSAWCYRLGGWVSTCWEHLALAAEVRGVVGFDAAILTDIGCARDNNEDAVVLIRPADPRELRRKGILAIVADGMGGHQAGEVASHAAVELIGRYYYGQPSADPLAALGVAVQQANRQLYAMAQSRPDYAGMGTTATAVVFRSGYAYWAHVGDSRLYRLRGDCVELLSEDHTYIAELRRRGLISAAEARWHPERNILTRALGTQDHLTVAACPRPLPVVDGDAYLLCSDGLYDLVDDVEIAQVTRRRTALEVCAQLIALAKSRGGRDNISVGFFRFCTASLVHRIKPGCRR